MHRFHSPSNRPDLAAQSVFISYSRSDLNIVKPLAAALRKQGIQTWLDLENLRPGERWKDAIDNALNTSSAMIFCLSPPTLESAWTNVELKAALKLGIPILPLVVGAIDIDQLPNELKTRQFYDMTRLAASSAPTIAARHIAIGLGMSSPNEQTSALPSRNAATLIFQMGAEPMLSSPPEEMNWISCEPENVSVWPVRALEATHLSDIDSALLDASHAIVAVSDDGETDIAHLLIGAIGARMGPRRITVAETSSRGGSLQQAADAVQAYYYTY